MNDLYYVKVEGSSLPILNGIYYARKPDTMSDSLIEACKKVNFDPEETWDKLIVRDVNWYENEHGSYVFQHKEKRWWMCEPNGVARYITAILLTNVHRVPTYGWRPLSEDAARGMPEVEHLQMDEEQVRQAEQEQQQQQEQEQQQQQQQQEQQAEPAKASV